MNHPKLLGLLIVLLALLATPATTAHDKTLRAAGQASASGKMTVFWGDPYTSMSYAYGTGRQTLSIRGDVTPKPDFPGYYTYMTIRLTGRAQAAWTYGGDRYRLEATFILNTDMPPMMPATIVPDANGFAITEMEFAATLTINGNPRQAAGMAALIAEVPGYFGFTGHARATMIMFYMSALGYHIVLSWSEIQQNINGIMQPAATRLRQKATLWGTK